MQTIELSVDEAMDAYKSAWTSFLLGSLRNHDETEQAQLLDLMTDLEGGLSEQEGWHEFIGGLPCHKDFWDGLRAFLSDF